MDDHKLFRLEVEFEGDIPDYESFQEFIDAMLDQFDLMLAPTHSVAWDIVSYLKAEIGER